MINEGWYANLEKTYGFEFCLQAGYFEETKPWNHKYSKWFLLPQNQTVIQYSGAFYPFHEGHLSIIKSAIDEMVERTQVNGGSIVLHVDHREYRISKGQFNENDFEKSFDLVKNFFPYKGFKLIIVNEDYMDDGCSRNFTRLYTELVNKNNDVYFLSGGDRANYSLTFVDHGKCIIAGRDLSNRYVACKMALESDRHWFIDGNNSMSSTEIRNKLIASNAVI